MDILITDDSGNVPLVEQRIVQKDDWIVLNGSMTGIPIEAMDYRSHRPSEHRATGPTGVFLDMEWGLDMDWYNRDACWRPYIPLRPEEAGGEPLSDTSSDWFFDFDMTTPYNHLSTGVFIVPEATRDQIHADITKWAWCVEDICSNDPFPPNTTRPPNFDLGTLMHSFSTLEELQAAGGICKRTAVDFLGFLAWWTASVSRWDASLDRHVIAIIKALQLDRFRRRGILIDLERHWQEINLPNLLQHRVPVAYPWTSTLASMPRFTSLSPRVLMAYDQTRSTLTREVHSSELHGLSSDFAIIKRFDHYFQELHAGGRPDPDVEFDDDWSYFIVDFQGWSCRQIPLRVARRYYLHFASSVNSGNLSSTVLFRRWEPLDNFSLEQPLPISVMEDVEESSVVRETREIRELHKYNHAPVDGAHFDLDGRPCYSTQSTDNFIRDKLKRRSRHPGDSTSRRWLQQMTDDQAHFTSASLDISSRGTRSSHPASRLSSDTCSRDHSASPRQRIYPQRRGNSPPDNAVLRQRAIARLRESCAVMMHVDTVWIMPLELDWDLSFLNDSFLLFPDSRTLTRLRYWAVCNPSITDARSLLELAISRNMKFVMATKLSDLKNFKPTATPELSELTKRTYEAGFQEEHLKDINGGAAFRDQYMGKLADILRRPHARALISMGGATAWIAKRYGGSSLVQRFLEGPSAQVTIHHRGAVVSSLFCDETLFHDQVSAQEENLVHGFVSAENPDHHRWLFPTTEILDDYCHHWRGEWTTGCDLIFHNIAKALEQGTAKPMTRKNWKSYLHSPNHGDRRPEVVLTPAHFAKADELLREFPDIWHGKRVADITIPVRFVPSGANQGGFVTDAQV